MKQHSALAVVSPCDLLRDSLVELASRVGFNRVAMVETSESAAGLAESVVATGATRLLVVTPGVGGLRDFIELVRDQIPLVSIATYCMVPSDESLVSDLACGAEAALCATDPKSVVERKLGEFARGEIVNSNDIRARARTLGQSQECDRALAAHLEAAVSPAEWRVLRSLATGASTADIAAELGVAHATVNTYIKRLLAKFGVASRLELMLMAIRLRVVSLDDDALTDH